MDRSRIARAEGFNHALHGAACVDDVLDDDDMAVCQVFVDADDLGDLTRRHGACIAGKFHKRDLTGDGNLTHEVGSEDERAIEHGQEQRVLVGQVIVDTLCNGFHVLQDFALGNRRLERLIKNLYGSHGFRY